MRVEPWLRGVTAAQLVETLIALWVAGEDRCQDLQPLPADTALITRRAMSCLPSPRCGTSRKRFILLRAWPGCAACTADAVTNHVRCITGDRDLRTFTHLMLSRTLPENRALAKRLLSSDVSSTVTKI